MDRLSLLDYLGAQLRRLCRVVGTDPAWAVSLLADLLGPVGSRPLSEPPLWPSTVADDHTPVEFSIAFNDAEPPTLRVLGEAMDPRPAAAANVAAAHRFIDAQASRLGLSMSRFTRVRDLFTAPDPQGGFGIWHSMVFRARRPPELKVYANPELTGVERAPALVAEAVDRLGLAAPYRAALDRGVRPGELGSADRLTFFALDLHDGPRARVKVYLTRHGARTADVVRAAGAIDAVDAGEFAWFCTTAGGTGTFDGLPLVGSYTFFEGTARPVGYSVYVPIRGYVCDDAQARERVMVLLDRYGYDGTRLDRAIAAITDRPLREGVGLIAHVSLRLGAPRPGVTVYLSAEAYRTQPPRPRPAAVREFAGRSAAPVPGTPDR